MNITTWKRINLIALLIASLSFLFLLAKVWYDAKYMASPLLPKYTAIYINASPTGGQGLSINLICFVLAGLVPALFLRIKKHYMISTFCLILFFVSGYLLKCHVNIYEHFFEFANYLF